MIIFIRCLRIGTLLCRGSLHLCQERVVLM